MSNLLINEPPLMVIPTLAAKIGLNEAIILQQIHYWLDPRGNKNFKDGRYWVYNSYKDWKKQFPFWAERTLQRTILSLEKLALLISHQLKINQGDSTKWYSINYEELAKISGSPHGAILALPPHAKESGPLCQNGTIYNKDTETTTEINTSSLNPSRDQSAKPRVYGERRRNKIISDQKDVEKPSDSLKVGEISLTMLQCWNEGVGKERGLLSITPQLSKLMEGVLNQEFQGDIDQWKSYCFKIASSQYLMGETKHGFKLFLSWCLKKDTIEKIRADFYTTGTREVSLETINTVDTIEAEENVLINKIRAGEGALPWFSFKGVFLKRILCGLEGLERLHDFKAYGWNSGGFQYLLEEYMERLTNKANNVSNDNTFLMDGGSLELSA